MAHVNSQHPKWIQVSEAKEAKQPTLGSSLISLPRPAVAESVKNLYGWIEWVCVGVKPFAFVDDPLTKLYTNLKPITSKTLKKHMSQLVRRVETSIAAELPERFALMIDGWTKSATHFIALFACYPTDSDPGYSTVLLAFSPLCDETQLTAQAHYDFIAWVLDSVYNKSMDNVVAIIGDNCEVNKAMCNLAGLPLIGCASHRFNLAVKKWLQQYEPVLYKVNSIMSKLKNLKMAGALRKLTDLRPVQRNVTRWSSTADMINRWFKLKPFLADFENAPELIDLWPSARENGDLNEMVEHSDKLNSVTKALQSESLSLLDVRLLFDEVIMIYPSMSQYLSEAAEIVHSHCFENAVVKILQERVDSLSESEAAMVAKLRVQDVAYEVTREAESSDFAASVLKRRRLEVSVKKTKTFLDCRFLQPTSNQVERFFSTAGMAYGDLRQRLLPINLEMQLFLKVNRGFWDVAVLSDTMANATDA